jgi:hypothetical protein
MQISREAHFRRLEKSRLKQETAALIIQYTLIAALPAGLRNYNKKQPE